MKSIQWIWGKLVKYLDNGRNQVFGRIYSIVQLVMTFAIFFTVSGTKIEIPQMIFWSIILFCLMITVGFFYSRYGFLSAEISSRTKESPELMETLHNTRRILEKLEEKELIE